MERCITMQDLLEIKGIATQTFNNIGGRLPGSKVDLDVGDRVALAYVHACQNFLNKHPNTVLFTEYADSFPEVPE